MVRAIVEATLEAEMTAALGAEKDERTEAGLGYRAGCYSRTLITRVGALELRVPQDREGRFSTRLLESRRGRGSQGRRPTDIGEPDDAGFGLYPECLFTRSAYGSSRDGQPGIQPHIPLSEKWARRRKPSGVSACQRLTGPRLHSVQAQGVNADLNLPRSAEANFPTSAPGDQPVNDPSLRSSVAGRGASAAVEA